MDRKSFGFGGDLRQIPSLLVPRAAAHGLEIPLSVYEIATSRRRSAYLFFLLTTDC
jgi:hypothetical protein